tara:strand:+ start:763 stop:2775 length:2013 start_codon:yes stop_codon:yes gene_type:complete
MNEILRRKLFNKVMNANQPTGILASSPEMVETVQRRANGGSYKAPTSNILSNALRSIRGLPAIRQAGDTSGAGMPEFTGTSGGTSMQRQAQMGDAIFGGIDTPEYLRFVESIKGLPYAQQVKAMQEAGYGATIGSKIEDTSSIFSNPDAPDVGILGAVKDGKAISIQELLGGTGKVARPKTTGTQTRTASGVDSLLGPEFKSSDPRTDAAMAVSSPRADTSADYVDQGDPRYRPGTVPTASYGEDIVDDEFTTGVPQTSVTAETAPVIAAAEKEVAESTEPQATASNISTTFDKLTANLNSILGGGKATEKINPQQAEKPSTHAALAAKIAEGPTAVEDVDLDKIEELVSETTGFDPEKSGEAKKGAFWNAVITAGLSIAAGESGNNLTNIAKGLGFAFDQYGKAVGELTAQDRADQKEARILRLSLIKDEKTANIAKAAKQDQYNQQVFQNDLALKQDGDTVAHRERQNAINVAQIYANAEIKMLEAVNTKAYRDGDLDIKQQTLDEARDKALRDAQPDHVQSLLAVGHAKMVDGTPKLLPEYEEVYGPSFIPEIIKLSALAGSKGGNKLTDTDDLTAAYNQQYNFLSAAQARILAEQTKSGNLENFGSVNNAIQELFGIPIENQQSGGGQGSIPEYNTQPSDEELGKLLQSGVTQIKIGGKTYPIQKN